MMMSDEGTTSYEWEFNGDGDDGFVGGDDDADDQYEVLDYLEFTSDRKRMSVVVRDCASRKIFLLSKGADEAILPCAHAEAAYEYGRGDFTRALELLGPDFDANNCKMVGASGEDLDVFNEVWYIMLLDAGHAEKAIEVIEKQLKMRDGTHFYGACWRGVIQHWGSKKRKV